MNFVPHQCLWALQSMTASHCIRRSHLHESLLSFSAAACLGVPSQLFAPRLRLRSVRACVGLGHGLRLLRIQPKLIQIELIVILTHRCSRCCPTLNEQPHYLPPHHRTAVLVHVPIRISNHGHVGLEFKAVEHELRCVSHGRAHFCNVVLESTERR